jgi:putative membrane protein
VDEPTIGAWLIWVIPLVLVAVLLVSVVLNLVRVILVDWNLTVTSTAAGLRRDAGLLSTTSIASSITRVQRVATKQGVLERLIGLQTVVLHTIGAGNFVIPGCDAEQVEEIRSLALEGSPDISSPTRRVSKQVVFKDVRNTTIVAIVVLLGLVIPLGWWALLVLLIIPVVWLTTRRSAHLRRWDLSHDAAANRHQLLGWSKEDLLLRKVNGTRLSQTRFERKRGLATVTLKTADGSMSIGMIPLTEAQAVRDRALYTAEPERRSWM